MPSNRSRNAWRSLDMVQTRHLQQLRRRDREASQSALCNHLLLNQILRWVCLDCHRSHLQPRKHLQSHCKCLKFGNSQELSAAENVLLKRFSRWIEQAVHQSHLWTSWAASGPAVSLVISDLSGTANSCLQSLQALALTLRQVCKRYRKSEYRKVHLAALRIWSSRVDRSLLSKRRWRGLEILSHQAASLLSSTMIQSVVLQLADRIYSVLRAHHRIEEKDTPHTSQKTVSLVKEKISCQSAQIRRLQSASSTSIGPKSGSKTPLSTSRRRATSPMSSAWRIKTTRRSLHLRHSMRPTLALSTWPLRSTPWAILFHLRILLKRMDRFWCLRHTSCRCRHRCKISTWMIIWSTRGHLYQSQNECLVAPNNRGIVTMRESRRINRELTRSHTWLTFLKTCTLWSTKDSHPKAVTRMILAVRGAIQILDDRLTLSLTNLPQPTETQQNLLSHLSARNLLQRLIRSIKRHRQPNPWWLRQWLLCPPFCCLRISTLNPSSLTWLRAAGTQHGPRNSRVTHHQTSPTQKKTGVN